MEKDIFKKNKIKFVFMGNEGMALSLISDNLYTLNETASFVLKNINGKRSKKEIINKFLKEYKAGRAQIEKDVENSLNFFIKNKLIKKL